MEINCKYCNSANVIKRGTNYNKQEYQCKDCKKYFRIGGDRIKRDIKEKELALLLYSHNTSIRSIQSVLNKYFDTNIAFNVIDNWIKTSYNLLNYDIKRLDKKEKPRTIEIIELDKLYTYVYDLKKERENVKVWAAIDRKRALCDGSLLTIASLSSGRSLPPSRRRRCKDNRNKIIAHQISKDSDKTENITCRKLLSEVIYDNNTKNNYHQERNKINIITSDGNWNYHRIIKCNYRKVVKVIKDKKGKLIKDNNNKKDKNKIKKETTLKTYNNIKSKYFIDCDKHIIDKAETTLIECKWSSLRGRFARFIRKQGLDVKKVQACLRF